MCSGTIFDSEVMNWVDFSEAARSGEHGFKDVPTRSGVYVLRVTSVGTADLSRVRQKFDGSRFFKAATALDVESERMFEALDFGSGWGWEYASHSGERLGRIDRIRLKEGKLQCPLLYIGKANSLWRRMTELARAGHTANAPFWALLMSGWKVEVGFRVTRKKAETAEEARLKALYKEKHAGALPPLVHR